MQTFATIFLSLSLALASASASPIESRAGTILCSADPVYTRPVSINVRFVDTGYKEVFYGLNSGSNVLVGTAANGTDFTKSSVTKFDFYQCKSKFLGTSNDGDYGVLKPKGDKKNCVQTKSGSVTTKDQVMVVAPCSTNEDQSQLQQTFQFSNGFLTLTSTSKIANSEQHPTFFRPGTASDKNALHLLAGNPRPPAFTPTDNGDYTGLSYIA